MENISSLDLRYYVKHTTYLFVTQCLHVDRGLQMKGSGKVSEGSNQDLSVFPETT